MVTTPAAAAAVVSDVWLRPHEQREDVRRHGSAEGTLCSRGATAERNEVLKPLHTIGEQQKVDSSHRDLRGTLVVYDLVVIIGDQYCKVCSQADTKDTGHDADLFYWL